MDNANLTSNSGPKAAKSVGHANLGSSVGSKTKELQQTNLASDIGPKTKDVAQAKLTPNPECFGQTNLKPIPGKHQTNLQQNRLRLNKSPDPLAMERQILKADLFGAQKELVNFVNEVQNQILYQK